MIKLYWITRLDSIHDFCTVLIFICSVIAAGLLVVLFDRWIYDDCEDMAICKKYLIIFISIVLSAITIKIFTPTAKEALLIYGVGSTIDYVKSNDTAKQLPDKTIQALDKYLNSINEDNK
jgi:hypothetical protein